MDVLPISWKLAIWPSWLKWSYCLWSVMVVLLVVSNWHILNARHVPGCVSYHAILPKMEFEFSNLVLTLDPECARLFHHLHSVKMWQPVSPVLISPLNENEGLLVSFSNADNWSDSKSLLIDMMKGFENILTPFLSYFNVKFD